MRLIDAYALMRHFMDKPQEYYHASYIVGEINTAPTIEERKTGKWIMHISEIYPADSTMECNICHAEQTLWCDENYCPNCGAKMDEWRSE